MRNCFGDTYFKADSYTIWFVNSIDA